MRPTHLKAPRPTWLASQVGKSQLSLGLKALGRKPCPWLQESQVLPALHTGSFHGSDGPSKFDLDCDSKRGYNFLVQILEASGVRPVFVGGNLGTPLSYAALHCLANSKERLFPTSGPSSPGAEAASMPWKVRFS